MEGERWFLYLIIYHNVVGKMGYTKGPVRYIGVGGRGEGIGEGSGMNTQTYILNLGNHPEKNPAYGRH